MIGTLPKIVTDLIPLSAPKTRRTGNKAPKTSITIHSTANLKSSAQSERNWLINPENKVRASWNICVDDREAVIAIPTNEESIHTSVGVANLHSISVEICESGNREKTLQNAVGLVAYLCMEHKIDPVSIRTHHAWTDKDCPRILLHPSTNWYHFLADVIETIDSMTDKPKVEPVPASTQYPAYKLNALAYMVNNKLIDSPDYWLENLDEPLPTWAFFVIAKRIHEEALKK